MIKLIVGLGNPGEEYKNTFHNLGFKFVDYVAKELNKEFKFKESFNSEITRVDMNNNSILLCKPQTFMNSSGEAVEKVRKYCGLKPEEILVVHDDLSVKIGKYKNETEFTSTKHNGVLNIIEKTNSKKFSRIRIGAAKPEKLKSIKSIDYVLGDIPEIYKEKYDEIFVKIWEEIKNGIENAD